MVKKIKLALMSAMFLALSVYGCSSSNDSESAHSDENWETSGHQMAMQEDPESCKECHGSDYQGGSAGVDCYDCHFGPQGVYTASTVIEIIGITPADAITDADGNAEATSPLPNVPINVYSHLRIKNLSAEGAVAWTLTQKPSDSTAALINEGSETKFLPDVKGFYTISATVTDPAAETVSDTVVIFANKWVGATKCKECHLQKYDSWKTTSHSDANDRKLELKYNGELSYKESCQKCHTVGYNIASYAVNNGYDDVALEEGFTIDNMLTLASFDKFFETYPKTAALSNIQCENCHGPNEEHKGVSSLSEKVCGQCHDSSGSHTIVYQWSLSGHSDYNATAFTYPVGDDRKACARCHTGGGFIDYMDGVAEEDRRSASQPVTCAVCHDPHDGENEYLIRTENDITLANGVVVTDGGFGKLCMNCHQSRQNVDTYVTEYHDHFGPHYAPQTDLYNGTGGYEYGETIAKSPHSAIIEDSCVTCHMGSPDDEALFNADKNAYVAGEHTFKMKRSDTEAENVAPCKICHSDITTFNFTAEGDYDGDGTVEGVQDEVKGLLDAIALKLPPLDSTDVTVADTYTPEELKAAYNYFFVVKDGSYGAHNYGYTVDLLRTTYKNLTGSELSGDGWMKKQ